MRYEVNDGSESYIEVYVDGDVQESSTVTGPAQQSYTSSDTIRFVSTETDGVHLYINDEEVTLKTNDSGIVNTTYKFEDIVNQWYEDHPGVSRSTASANSTTSNTDNASSADSSKNTSANSSSGNTNSRSSSSQTDE